MEPLKKCVLGYIRTRNQDGGFVKYVFKVCDTHC